MGKSDKNKKYSKFLTGISSTNSNSNGSKSKTGAVSLDNNIAYDIASDSGSKTSYTGVFIDLTSLDEAKRYKACSLVCNIFSNVESSSISKSILDKFATVEVLNKLNLRLMDASDRIKLIAAATFRNIAATGNLEVSNNMLSAGIVSSIVNAVTSLLTSNTGSSISGLISKASFLEQLIATLCNISAATTQLEQILKSIFAIIPLLLQLVLVDIPSASSATDSPLSQTDVLKLLHLRTVVWKTLLVWSDDSVDFSQYITLSTDPSLTTADYRGQLILLALRDCATVTAVAAGSNDSGGTPAMFAAANDGLIQILCQSHQVMAASLLINICTSTNAGTARTQAPDAVVLPWCEVTHRVVNGHGLTATHPILASAVPTPSLFLSVVIAKLSWVSTWYLQSVQLDLLRQLKDAVVEEAVGAESQNQQSKFTGALASSVWEQAYACSQSTSQLSMETVANLVISPLFQHCLAMRVDLSSGNGYCDGSGSGNTHGEELSGMLQECMDEDGDSAVPRAAHMPDSSSAAMLSEPVATTSAYAPHSPIASSSSGSGSGSGSGSLSLSTQVLDNYTTLLSTLHSQHVGQVMLLLLSPATPMSHTGATAVLYKVPLDRVMHLITGQLQYYEHVSTGIINILSIIAQCLTPPSDDNWSVGKPAQGAGVGSPESFLAMLAERVSACAASPSANIHSNSNDNAWNETLPRISRLLQLAITVYTGITLSLTDLWNFLARGSGNKNSPVASSANSITGFILSSEAASLPGVVALPVVEESTMQLSDLLASDADGSAATVSAAAPSTNSMDTGGNSNGTSTSNSNGRNGAVDNNEGEKADVDFTGLRAVLVAACIGSTHIVDLCLQCLNAGTDVFSGDIYGQLCTVVNNQQGGLLKGIMGLVPAIPSEGCCNSGRSGGRSVEMVVANATLLSTLCALSLSLTASAGPGAGLVLLSNNYVLVLTNMLLKKLQQQHTDYVTAAAAPTSVTPKVLDTVATKYYHLLSVTYLVNTVIDLHSSDDEFLLNGYRKFNVQSTLTSLNTACKAQWKDLTEYCRLQAVSSQDYDDVCPQDAFIKGVIINLREFLKYKKSFL